MMKRNTILHFTFYIIPLTFVLSVLSCSDDKEDAYPSLITEMVMAKANAEGKMASFTTDDGTTYLVDNTISGMTANDCLRCLCTYLMETAGHVKVYRAEAVPILWDYTNVSTMKRDPTGIQSAWLSGGYINLHLTPKTQGGKQAWGFTRDSVTQNTLGGSTYHLSLYHDQRDDFAAYSTDLFACISLDSIPQAPATLSSLDSIRLTVQTFTASPFKQAWKVHSSVDS